MSPPSSPGSSLDGSGSSRNRKRSPTSRRPKRSRNRLGLWIGVGSGVLLLIVGTVGATLWVTGFFSDPEIVQKPNIAAAKPVEPASTPKASVSGELFVTTNGGDVKKAAGQKIHFTRITPEFEKSIVDLLSKADSSEAEQQRLWDEGYSKYLKGVGPFTSQYESRKESFDREYGTRLSNSESELRTVTDDAREILLHGVNTAVANGEGRFNLDLQAGRYLLWTGVRTMGQQSFSWCKIVEIRDAPLNLILSDEFVFLYPDSIHTFVSINPEAAKGTHLLLQKIVAELSRQ